MDTATPLWVTLLVAALGIAGTLLAALVTQSVTTRRENARADALLEQERERAREELDRAAARATSEAERQDVRARLAAERAEAEASVARRREAYTELLVAAGRWDRYISQKRDHRLARNGGAVPIEAGPFEDAVDRAYAAVQILGDAALQQAAHAVYHNLIITMVHLEASHFSVNRVDESSAAVAQSLAELLTAVRKELGVDEDTPRTA